MQTQSSHQTYVIGEICSPCTLVIFALLTGSPVSFPHAKEFDQGLSHQWAHPLPADTFFSAHNRGEVYARARWPQHLLLCPYVGPGCTWSRLSAFIAAEYDWPVTQSIATPEPCCPSHHPGSRADGLVQGEPPPISPPYQVATTYLLRQDVDSPFSPLRVPPRHTGDRTNASSRPSRVRRRLLSTCLGDPILLAIDRDVTSSSVDFAISTSLIHCIVS